MNGNYNSDFYLHIESKMHKLFETISSKIQHNYMKDIYDYVDAKEYGIALEDVVYSIIEDSVAIDNAEYNFIEDIAQLMEMNELLSTIHLKLINNIQ